MSTTHQEHLPFTREPTGLGPPLKAALLILAPVGAFCLLREHWNYIGGNWVYLLLLACPLMHLFHGHGSHGGRGDQAAPPDMRKE